MPSVRQRIARSVAKNPITKRPFAMYVDWMNQKRRDRFDTCSPTMIPVLREEFKKAPHGDYYEFGLYKGYMFYVAHECAKEAGIHDIQFFGFDSFEGLPDVQGIDQEGRFKQGDYACDIDTVVKNLNSKSINWKNTFLIKGFFSDSLQNSRYPYRNVKIAVIDCDLYESTKPVLDFLHPYLQVGSVLVFDDWNCFNAENDKGQRRALQEFLAKHPSLRVEERGSFGWHGAYFHVTAV